ncbi:MAG: hypothetical protein ACI4VC_05965 [Clostridia bacterium]
MADATQFNLKDGQKAERKLLVTAVNVGDSITKGSGTPEWQIIGVGVEDSSIEYNPDTETKTDILGITETTVNKLETSQTLEPMTVRGGSKLAVKLYNQIKYNRVSEFAMYEVMQIHAYVGTDGAYEAEVHKNCTITPQSLGGDAYVDMPIDINYSNDKVHGTVDNYKYGSTITFTAI